MLKAQGAELVDVPDDFMENVSEQASRSEDWNFKHDLEEYLKDAPPAVKIRNMADLIAFSKTEEHEKLHGIELFESAEATTDGLQNAEYVQMREYIKRKTGPEGLGKALADYNVSALVLLTRGPAPLLVPDGTRSEGPRGERGKGPPSMSQMAAVAGYPHLTIPLGFVDALPIGFSFMGTANADAHILALGHAFEQITQATRAPEFREK